MYVASTLALPLSALCFTSHYLLHDHAKEFSINDLIGMGIIIVGIILYRFMNFDNLKRPSTPYNVMNLYAGSVVTSGYEQVDQDER